jgi:hypothetical protein
MPGADSGLKYFAKEKSGRYGRLKRGGGDFDE